MRLRAIVFPVVLLAPVLAPGPASGHAQYKPFSINRYTVISFEGEGVRFTYDVTVGDVPAQKLRQRSDDDGDGVLSDEEVRPLKAWMQELLRRGLRVHLDGRPTPIEPQLATFRLVETRVKKFAPIVFRFRFEIPAAYGRHELVFHDQASIPDLEQTELFVRERKGMLLERVYRVSNRRGLVRHMFWEQGRAPGPVLLGFELFGPGEEAGQEERPIEDGTEPLKRVLARERLGFWGLVVALALAFIIGAAHALSPGHGKTLVAAYLVGSRGKVRHALALGLIVTFTHVFSVVILGLLALWATERAAPERAVPWLSLAAGLMVLGIGGWMLTARVRRGHHPHPPGAGGQHGRHAEVRWGELLMLGISGGMVPCLSATVVLLAAIHQGRIAEGFALIGAFSLGLAATLTGLGILVVQGRSLFARWSSGRRGEKIVEALPQVSAAAVTALGVVMTLLAAARL